MRLQLNRVQQRAARLLFAFALIALAAPAAGADEFVTKTQIYTDNDHTTVVSPLVRISKDAWRGGILGASFVADVVTSASVDVVTNATARMTDFRKEVAGTITQKISDTTLSGAYIYSAENDYQSHNFNLGLTQDFLQKNSTLAVSYAGSLNDVGRSGDANFHKSLDVHTVDAAWTQLLNARTLMEFAYTFGYATGYQASPYRFVHVESSPDFKVPETDPDQRFRHAFVVGLKRHVLKDSAIQLDYRFYLDNWGVTSHTGQFQYVVDFGAATLRLRQRFYYQTAASFFQSHYTEVGEGGYLTADRELSTLWSTLTGAKVTIKADKLVKGLSLEAKADVFYFSYIDFAYLHSRLGANLAAGLNMKY